MLGHWKSWARSAGFRVPERGLCWGTCGVPNPSYCLAVRWRYCVSSEDPAFPVPNGWFAVSFSDEVQPMEVRSLRCFGRDLVLYRGESGAAYVLEAFCPHLGAHLAHGGSVVGERLRCPFHAWEWQGESGACAHIPYAKRIPTQARIGKLPTLERNGYVLAWHHAENSPPEYEIPELPELRDEGWTDYEKHEWIVEAPLQEMGENAADSAHFQVVHGTRNVPVTQSTVEGVHRRMLQPIRMKTPRGIVEGAIDTHVYGMGFSFTRFTGIAETLEVACSTPIDEMRSHIRFGFTQPRHLEGGGAEAMIREIVKQMNEDIPIWEHKRYRARPVLCEGDGPIPEYRRWCGQFYSR